MGITWQQAGIFVAGAAAGAVATALLVTGLRPSGPADEPRTAAQPQGAALHLASACPDTPLLLAGSGKDGRFQLPAEVKGYAVPDVGSFISTGREAAANGRSRDAEVAFLTACRVADRFAGAGSIDAADARQHLAAHYEAAAGGPVSHAARDALLKRAEALYSDSVQIYAAAFGMYHEKTELASTGLLHVRQTLGPAGAALSMGAAPAPKALAEAPAPPPAPVPDRMTRTSARKPVSSAAESKARAHRKPVAPPRRARRPASPSR